MQWLQEESEQNKHFIKDGDVFPNDSEDDINSEHDIENK